MTENDVSPTRRQFLMTTVGAGAAVWLAGCDSDTTPPTDAGGGGTDAGAADAGAADAGPLQCNQIMFEASSRHFPGGRHAVDVPLADVMAAAEQTYDIQGESTHTHTLTVTAAHFAMIATGARVEIESSPHSGSTPPTHIITLFCSA